MENNSMNEIYEGSILNTCTINCHDEDKLLLRLRYSGNAVDNWHEKGNKEQANFFQKDVELIVSKLNKMNNPISFKQGDFIRSVYDLKVYEVIEPDKKGMAKLLNTETNGLENWNSCNNPHFVKQEKQLTLF